jgi:hypothetical protein
VLVLVLVVLNAILLLRGLKGLVCQCRLLLLLLMAELNPSLLLKHLKPFGGWWVGPWRLWGADVRLLQLLG